MPLTSFVDLNWSLLFRYERGTYSIELTAESNDPGIVGSIMEEPVQRIVWIAQFVRLQIQMTKVATLRVSLNHALWFACILHWFVNCSYFLSILLIPRSTPFRFSLKGNACRVLKQLETFPGWNRDRNKVWVRSVLKDCCCILQFPCRVWTEHLFTMWCRIEKLWGAFCVNRLEHVRSDFLELCDMISVLRCQNA